MVMVINRRNKVQGKDRDEVSSDFTVEAESFPIRQALI